MDLNSREISVDSSTTLGQYKSSVMTGRSPDGLHVFLDSVYSRMSMPDAYALPTVNQQCRSSEESAISGKRFYSTLGDLCAIFHLIFGEAAWKKGWHKRK